MKIYSTLAATLLAGMAHAGTPTFSPASIDFGNVQIGSSKSIQVVLGLSSSSDNLRTLGVDEARALTNSTAYKDFSLALDTCHYSGTDNSGSPLSTSTSCQFTLTYTPTSAGSTSAVVTATDYQQGHWGTANVSATANARATSVPTLGEWSLIALSSLLAMFGLARSRRRQH